jgi:hypothetical protein
VAYESICNYYYFSAICCTAMIEDEEIESFISQKRKERAIDHFVWIWIGWKKEMKPRRR